MPFRTSKLRISTRIAVIGLLGVIAARPLGAGQTRCVGDCNGDERVVIAELIRAVSVNLGLFDTDYCSASDANDDGRIRINELIQAVNNALNGCGGSAPTPTPTPTPVVDTPLPWTFAEVAEQAGAQVLHARVSDDFADQLGGGVAAGDYDDDGLIDLYVGGGHAGANALLRNLGDGSFVEVSEAGLPQDASPTAALTFADIDGDNSLDLIVGGIAGSGTRIFGGQTNHVFVEETAESNLRGLDGNTVGTALADFDGDGDLDLCLGRRGTSSSGAEPVEHLFRNDDDWILVPVGTGLGIRGLAGANEDLSVTPAFTDVDNDGDQDLIFASDSGTSEVFRNQSGTSFAKSDRDRELTDGDRELTDENASGLAGGDYDGDGDLDWFVSGIADPNGVAEGFWGVTGNRLFRNDDASFTDITDVAEVRTGSWAWAACSADFNNDGHLDLFQVNGFEPPESDEFIGTPSPLFVNDGDGTFTEMSTALGLDDTSNGRGLACFDYDRDGDVDIFIAANNGTSTLWRNDGGNQRGRYLTVQLSGRVPNTQAVGARVTIESGGRRQVRELRAGGGFSSQVPGETHFGLGNATTIERLNVRWPRGNESELRDIGVDQVLQVTEPQ